MPHEWNVVMHDFFKDLRNDEVKRKQTELLSCKEGKTKMCVRSIVFRHIAAFFHNEARRHACCLQSQLFLELDVPFVQYMSSVCPIVGMGR